MKKTFLSITLGATILLTGGVNATALSVSNPNSDPLKVTILDGNSAFAFHNEMRLTNGGRFTIGDAFFENSTLSARGGISNMGGALFNYTRSPIEVIVEVKDPEQSGIQITDNPTVTIKAEAISRGENTINSTYSVSRETAFLTEPPIITVTARLSGESENFSCVSL